MSASLANRSIKKLSVTSDLQFIGRLGFRDKLVEREKDREKRCKNERDV